MLSVVLGDAIGVGVLDAILTGRVIAAGNFPDQPATISSSTPTSTSKPCATVNTSAPAASPTYSLGNTPALTSTMALKNPSHPTTPKSASASPNTSSAIPFRSKKSPGTPPLKPSSIALNLTTPPSVILKFSKPLISSQPSSTTSRPRENKPCATTASTLTMPAAKPLSSRPHHPPTGIFPRSQIANSKSPIGNSPRPGTPETKCPLHAPPLARPYPKSLGSRPSPMPCSRAPMKPAGAIKRPGQVDFLLSLPGLWEGIVQLPRPSPPPFDIETMEPIEPP